MMGFSVHMRLGDVCGIIKGKKPRNISDTREHGEIPYILIESFTNSPTKFTDDLELPQCHPEDVLMVMDGASSGRVVIGMEGAIGSTLAAIRPDRRKLHPKYVYYWLRTKYEFLNRRTRGSAIPHIDKKLLQDLLIPAPPIETQRRITSVLERADNLRKKREQANQLTNNLVQFTFLKKFGDASRSNLWPKHSLGELCSIIRDGPHRRPKYQTSGIPFLTVHNISESRFILDDVYYTSPEEHAQIKKRVDPRKGDVLYTKGGTTGIAKEVDVDFEFSIYVHVALLRPRPELINPTYLETCLNSKYCRAQAARLTRGIANRDLVLGQMKQVMVPTPPLALQEEFARYVKNARKLQERQHLMTTEVDKLFQSILYKAFRGELRLTSQKGSEGSRTSIRL